MENEDPVIKLYINKCIDEKLGPIIDLDKNVDALKKDIAELKTILSGTCQFVAENSVEHTRVYLENWSSEHSPELWQKIHDFLTSKSATAKANIRKSTNPISVFFDFQEKCITFFEKQNLHPFSD